MSLMIQYQNLETGDAFDITTLVKSAQWTTKRSGYPASLELSVLDDPAVDWVCGGILTAQNGKEKLFYGYLFQIDLDEEGTVGLTAYDQTRYLKNKDTYVFTGKRADQIVAQIAADFRLKTVSLPGTGYAIPSMVEDGQTLFDIILKALDLTLINAGRMFYLWDDFGALRLSEVKASGELVVLGDESLTTGYTYSVEIDSQTSNKVKLVRDNKETGKRDVYLFQDSNNIKRWGVLQNYEKVDENWNAAQITAQGDRMLALYNRPARSLELKAVSLPEVRAGKVIFVDLSSAGLKQPFLVEEARHDLLEETMTLKVKVV